MDLTKQNALISNNIPEPKLVRPRHVKKLVVLLSVLCLTTFYSGYCIAYITALGAKDLAIVYGPTTAIPAAKAFLISAIPWGIAFGTFISPWIIPLASRRNLTLILCIIAQILQFTVQANNLIVFFLARPIQGIVAGLFLALIPMYVRQICPKDIPKRGIYGIFGNIFFIIGFMTTFGFNRVLVRTNVDQLVRWRIVVSVNFFAILIILICILVGYMPQSPNSLIAKGQQQKAKQVIGLFHHERFIEEVYLQKVKEVEDAKKPPQPPKKDRPLIKTILAFQVPVMHQLTGVNAYISQMGFVTAEFDNDFGNYVPLLMGAIQVITAIYSVTFLYRVSRRTLVLSGNFGMSICCFGIGISFLLINQFSGMFWVVVTFVIIFFGFHGAFLIPAVWLYVPQVATKQEIRWSQVVNWVTCASSVTLFIIIGSTFGYASIFLTFGTITMICFIFNAFFMIETKPNVKQQLNMELRNVKLSDNSSEDREQSYRDQSYRS